MACFSGCHSLSEFRAGIETLYFGCRVEILFDGGVVDLMAGSLLGAWS